MNTSPRRTRFQRRLLQGTQNEPVDLTTRSDAAPSQPNPISTPESPQLSITPLSARLTTKQTNLPRTDHALLLRKQSLLQTSPLPTPSSFPPSALAASLVFAQHEAGTAVCIQPSGLLLTCAHCVAEEFEELDLSGVHWLLFASGRVVGAQCVAWDAKLDLALLRVIAAQGVGEFPAVEVAQDIPQVGTKLVCVGHPGSEDLEAAEPGRKTGYDVLHVSEGRFRGCADGQDRLDNEEIGALMHNCWTYWGHSGAPLLERRTGKLVGLHSSWDEETGMRRGIPLEAVNEFLGRHLA